MGTLIKANQDLTADLLNQYHGQADTSPNTVTAAAQTPLHTPYTIPANEPVAGSAYQVHFGGSGVWGSTQQLIALTLVVQGLTVVNTVNAIAAAAFNASSAFRYNGYADIVFSSAGETGGVKAGLWFTLSESANPVNPGAASSNTFSVADTSVGIITPVDTTRPMAVTFNAGWGGTVGGPTITNTRTIFQKVA